MSRSLLAVVCLLCGVEAIVSAQDANWIGKRIVVKRPGLKIGYSDKDGRQIYVAVLSQMAYTVMGDQAGFVKVQEREHEGWLDKEEALLVDDAIAHYSKKIADDPSEPIPYAFRGWAQKEKGAAEAALRDYDTALRLKPNAEWFNNRGLIKVDLKQYDAAIADFTEAMRLDPKMVVAYENRGQVYITHKNWDPALRDFSDALKLDAKYAPLYFKRTQIHLGRNDLAKAMDDVNAGLALDPKNHHALLVRGNIHMDRHDLDKALADYTKAIELNAKFPEAYFQRAVLHAAKKEHDKALKDSNEGLRLQPDNAAALAQRGWSLFMTKKYAEARADYERAVGLDAKEISALNNWAWMLATCPDDKYRDGKQAVALAKKACELTMEKDPGCLDTMAAAYAEVENFDEAVRYQNRVLEDKSLDKELADEARIRLKLYMSKKAYRQK
jgi:tetratricopeptide (TPR) repeat protein